MTWKFEQPRNLAVITVQRIVDGETSVVYVSHDEEDGGWQFLDGQSVAEGDARVVGLGRMVDSDHTLIDLANLPEGFIATRESKGARWVRMRKQ